MFLSCIYLYSLGYIWKELQLAVDHVLDRNLNSTGNLEGRESTKKIIFCQHWFHLAIDFFVVGFADFQNFLADLKFSKIYVYPSWFFSSPF